jgi:hypothetical protein
VRLYGPGGISAQRADPGKLFRGSSGISAISCTIWHHQLTKSHLTYLNITNRY